MRCKNKIRTLQMGMLAGLIQLAANKEEYIKMSMDLSKSEFLEDGFGMLYHSIENIL